MDVLRWSDDVRHPGFFIDMRAGKTLITIRRIKRWHAKEPFLIICPGESIQGWFDELVSEGYTKIFELTGTKSKREKMIKLCFSGVYIINKEGHLSIPEIKNLKWSVVVFDESRYIANPKSKMSKYYVSNFRNAEHRVILTGTPDFKDKLDYFQQLQFLDYNILPYKNFWEFRAKAFHAVDYEFIIKKKDNDILTKALSKNTYVLKREDIPGGRTSEYIRKTIELPSKLRKEYDVVEQEYVYEEQDMKTIFATQSHIWMMRLCGGFRKRKNSNKYDLIWDGKIKILKELLKNELQGQNVVIFCRFKVEVYYIKTILLKLGFKTVAITGDAAQDLRRIILKNFRCKNFNILCAHPNAISHGTDMSSATTIIFYSQPNGKEIRSQSEKRIMTYADELHMLIIDILVKNTIDEDTRNGYLENESSRTIFDRAVQRWKS